MEVKGPLVAGNKKEKSFRVDGVRQLKVSLQAMLHHFAAKTNARSMDYVPYSSEKVRLKRKMSRMLVQGPASAQQALSPGQEHIAGSSDFAQVDSFSGSYRSGFVGGVAGTEDPATEIVDHLQDSSADPEPTIRHVGP